MVKETEYYDLLCVEVTATDEQIKKAYRKQALKYHPDRPTGDTEKFKELSKAFQILSDSNTRYIYLGEEYTVIFKVIERVISDILITTL